MATVYSLIPDVLDGLVTGLRAATGFRSPTSSSDGVTVYDGPEWVGANADDPDGFVVVGYGGEDLESRGVGDDPGPAVSGDTQVRSISTAASKEQDLEVPCVVYTWSGAEEDVSALRSSAFDALAAVEVWLTANPRLGVTPGASNEQVLWATATGSHSLRQYKEGGGVRCVVEFTITVRTRT